MRDSFLLSSGDEAMSLGVFEPSGLSFLGPGETDMRLSERGIGVEITRGPEPAEEADMLRTSEWLPVKSWERGVSGALEASGA